MKISYENFMRKVEEIKGEELPTVGGRATFSLKETESGVSFVPRSSGVPRKVNREGIELYLDYFNKTGSTNTSDYSARHRNQSYVLAVIKLIVGQSLQARLIDDGVSHTSPIDPEFDAPEGMKTIRSHRRRERSRELVLLAKNLFSAKFGRLFCEICDFDFGKIHEEPDFIEVHHLIPLRDLREDHRTKLSDLAMVCPNCHRMLHRGSPWPTLDELKSKMVRIRDNRRSAH